MFIEPGQLLCLLHSPPVYPSLNPPGERDRLISGATGELQRGFSVQPPHILWCWEKLILPKMESAACVPWCAVSRGHMNPVPLAPSREVRLIVDWLQEDGPCQNLTCFFAKF